MRRWRQERGALRCCYEPEGSVMMTTALDKAAALGSDIPKRRERVRVDDVARSGWVD